MSPATIKASKRTFAIAYFILTGWTPWGVQLPWRSLSLCAARGPKTGPEWVMCCGHVLSVEEADRWLAAGLVIKGPTDEHGRPTLAVGPALERWVSLAFSGLQARQWGQTDA